MDGTPAQSQVKMSLLRSVSLKNSTIGYRYKFSFKFSEDFHSKINNKLKFMILPLYILKRYNLHELYGLKRYKLV
jgi:hypothetical protein